jgi:predicted DNA-binding transcriptional regulator AlpA
MEAKTKVPGTMQDVIGPLALSAEGLRQRLDVSLRHIRRMDSAGKLPKPIRLGASVRWPVAEIEAWLAAGAPDRLAWEQAKGVGA